MDMDLNQAKPNNMIKIVTTIVCVFSLCYNSHGRQNDTSLNFTLDQAIAFGLEHSYLMKQVKSRLEQSQHYLRAWQKSYSSYANLEAYAPVFTNRFTEIPDPETGKIRIVRQNHTSYRSSLIISQPIWLTDGTLSLSNSLYHLRQADETNYQYDVVLNYNQPIFKTSVRKIDLKQARLNLQQAQLAFQNQKRELIFYITQEYLNLLRAQQNLDIARESAQRSKEVYDLACAKYQTGLYSEMDLLRFEVDVANDKNTMITQQENYQKLLENFRLTIGMPREAEIGTLLMPNADSLSISYQQLFQKALKNSPERVINEINLELDELGIKRTKARREFAIDMNLEYGFSQIKNDLGSFFKQPEMIQIGSIRFSIPLWDSGQNREHVLAAKEQLHESEIELEHSIESLKIKVREILLALEKARQRLAISKKTERNARKSYQYSLLQFNAGSITSDELTLSRNRLNTASLNHLDAQIEHLVALERIKMHLTEIKEYSN